MSDPAVDSNFRTCHFKCKKDSFFANTDDNGHHHFYTFAIHSGDSPKTFNEIFDKWYAGLKFIKKQKNVPKSIVNFVEELIEFNQSKELTCGALTSRISLLTIFRLFRVGQ